MPRPFANKPCQAASKPGTTVESGVCQPDQAEPVPTPAHPRPNTGALLGVSMVALALALPTVGCQSNQAAHGPAASRPLDPVADAARQAAAGEPGASAEAGDHAPAPITGNAAASPSTDGVSSDEAPATTKRTVTTTSKSSVSVSSSVSGGWQLEQVGESPWLFQFVEKLMPASGSDLSQDALYPYDPDIRQRAVSQLVDHKYGNSANALRVYRLLLGASGTPPTKQFSPDSAATVRSIACKAVGLHGSPADADLLASFLTDDNDIVRLEAATALQKLHAPNSQAPNALVVAVIGNSGAGDLLAVRGDESADVRAAAALALAQYRTPRAFNALITGLFDRDFAVVAACHHGLQTMTGVDDASTDPDTWLAIAEAKTPELFADARTYFYEPYPTPAGFWRSLVFWAPYEPPAPRQPVGADGVPDRTPTEPTSGWQQNQSSSTENDQLQWNQ